MSAPLTGRPRWDDHPGLDLPPLSGDAEAEVCVVGLGGTGLSCIGEALARGARRVVGIDAAGVAAGAAGRNGGLLLSGTADFHHDAVERLGHDRAVAITRRTMAEIDRIAAEVPDAVRRTGSLRIAADEAEREDCERQRAAMVADGFAAERYEGPEGRGILIPTDAAFHPIRRCRALATRALAAGARLHGATRAEEVVPGLVRTAHGTIRARHVIVCVDGGLERLVPSLAGRVRTARLQMLASAPAPEVSFPRPVSTRDGYDYWLQLPDGSVLLGGGRDTAREEEWTDDPTPTATIQDYLTRVLRERLGVRAAVTHRWGAIVGYANGPLPVVERPDEGLLLLGGYSGTGNVVGAVCGRGAAEWALTGRPDLLAPFLA